MRGEQANIETVAAFQLKLQALVDQADKQGVVLTIDTVAPQPIAMGNYAMHPLARPCWWNVDKPNT